MATHEQLKEDLDYWYGQILQEIDEYEIQADVVLNYLHSMMGILVQITILNGMQR